MPPTIVILAAGACRRFGQCKHIAPLGDSFVIQQLLTECKRAVDWPIVIVSGCYDALLKARLPDETLLYNAEWANGLASSIAFASQQLHEAPQLLFILGDQVALKAEDIRCLATERAATPSVCAYYRGKRGVPARFDRSLYPALHQLQGDTGAKALLNSAHTMAIAMPRAAIDIDTPEDLADYCANLKHTAKNTPDTAT